MEVKKSDIPCCKNDKSSGEVLLTRSSMNMCTPMYAFCKEEPNAQAGIKVGSNYYAKFLVSGGSVGC